MTADEVRIGEAVAALRARLEAGPVENPAAFAHEYVTDMLRQGWRPRALAVVPVAPSYSHGLADAETRAEAMKACRANVAAARQAATAMRADIAAAKHDQPTTQPTEEPA